MAVEEHHEGLGSAVSGLTCVLGRDVFQRNGGTSVLQFALPEEFSAFGLDPLEEMQASPDGKHVSFVVVQGDQRRIGIAGLPGHDVRILPYVLSSVHGMSWSPDGTMLCVVAEDPSIGMVSIARDLDTQPPSSFSLFLTGVEDDDLRPIAGPVVLPGVPRWSPAGDAVAVATQRHSGMETLSIMTTDGLAGDFVAGRGLRLGDAAWTDSAHVLCAVSSQSGLTHVLLVNVTTGGMREVDKPWDDVAWLTALGERILVAGHTDSGWTLADVTQGTRRVLTQAFADITQVAAQARTVWMVTRQDEATMGLWTLNLPDERLHLHTVARVIRDLRVRQTGAIAAVLAGNAGQEMVQVYGTDLAGVVDLGHRDMLVGWLEKADHAGRRRRTAYLLDSTWQPVEIVDDDADLGESTHAQDEPATLVNSEIAPAQDSTIAASKSAAGSNRRRMPRWVWWTVCLVLVAAVAGPAIAGALSRRNGGVSPAAGTSDIVVHKPSDQTAPTVQTPPSSSGPPSAVEPGQEVTTNPDEVPSTQTSPAPGPSAQSTGGIAIGKWVAATESLHVRQGAGTDEPILGNLPPSGRAKVLAGPSKVGGMLWWRVQCYDAAGKQTLSGWVSGTYLKIASAPAVSTSPSKPADTGFVAPAKGTLIVASTPVDALVAVDGSIAGTTPVTLSVTYGNHDVSVMLDGYMQYNTLITVTKPTSPSEVRPVQLDVGLIALPAGE